MDIRHLYEGTVRLANGHPTPVVVTIGTYSGHDMWGEINVRRKSDEQLLAQWVIIDGRLRPGVGEYSDRALFEWVEFPDGGEEFFQADLNTLLGSSQPDE